VQSIRRKSGSIAPTETENKWKGGPQDGTKRLENKEAPPDSDLESSFQLAVAGWVAALRTSTLSGGRELVMERQREARRPTDKLVSCNALVGCAALAPQEGV